MFKKIHKYINNKKGETVIIFVLSMLFLFWVMLFIIDLFRLTYIQLDATSLMREAVDIVSNQGGISTSAPSQFPTDRVRYITSKEVSDLVNETMVNKGVSRGDVYLFYVEKETKKEKEAVLNETTNVAVDYGDEIKIRLRYGFDFISIPNPKDKDYDMVLNITRTTLSKYKHRNDSDGWDGV